MKNGKYSGFVKFDDNFDVNLIPDYESYKEIYDSLFINISPLIKNKYFFFSSAKKKNFLFKIYDTNHGNAAPIVNSTIYTDFSEYWLDYASKDRFLAKINYASFSYNKKENKFEKNIERFDGVFGPSYLKYEYNSLPNFNYTVRANNSYLETTPSVIAESFKSGKFLKEYLENKSFYDQFMTVNIVDNKIVDNGAEPAVKINSKFCGYDLEIHVNENGVIHNENGFAMSYKDLYTTKYFYCINGVPITDKNQINEIISKSTINKPSYDVKRQTNNKIEDNQRSIIDNLQSSMIEGAKRNAVRYLFENLSNAIASAIRKSSFEEKENIAKLFESPASEILTKIIIGYLLQNVEAFSNMKYANAFARECRIQASEDVQKEVINSVIEYILPEIVQSFDSISEFDSLSDESNDEGVTISIKDKMAV